MISMINLYEQEVLLQWDVQHVSEIFFRCCDNQSTTFLWAPKSPGSKMFQWCPWDVVDKVNFAQNCFIIFIYPANIAMENGWT